MITLSTLVVSIRTLATSLTRRQNTSANTSSQLEAVEQARREWVAAAEYYHEVRDPELVEHAVFELKARERRYMYLINRARAHNVVVDDRTFGKWLAEREI